MVTFSDIVETRACKLHAFTLVGYEGQSMDEEKHLFNQLNEHANEISAVKSDNRYLVVLGKFIVPFVALEVTDATNVPSLMKALTIPEDEYVAFKFSKKHVGDFWATVCTAENQNQYNIDLSKPRFEIFTPELQDTGLLEWYIPTKTK